MVLAVVLLIAFTLAFPTVRAYLGQRAQLDALAADVVAAEQREEELQAELDRWSEPAYIQAQARERLSFVMPGETAYRVIDPEIVVEPPTVDGAAPEAGPTLPVGGSGTPWYTTIWTSVRIAGELELEDPGGQGVDQPDGEQPAADQPDPDQPAADQPDADQP